MRATRTHSRTDYCIVAELTVNLVGTRRACRAAAAARHMARPPLAGGARNKAAPIQLLTAVATAVLLLAAPSLPGATALTAVSWSVDALHTSPDGCTLDGGGDAACWIRITAVRVRPACVGRCEWQRRGRPQPYAHPSLLSAPWLCSTLRRHRRHAGPMLHWRWEAARRRCASVRQNGTRSLQSGTLRSSRAGRWSAMQS